MGKNFKDIASQSTSKKNNINQNNNKQNIKIIDPRYSNNNILAQAGQSMLAQANQSNQGVLSLLQ